MSTFYSIFVDKRSENTVFFIEKRMISPLHQQKNMIECINHNLSRSE